MKLIEKYNENQIETFIYENRYKIGVNFLDFIKDNGYIKSSI